MDKKNPRYHIKRQITKLKSKTNKFKIQDKADYVLYGKKAGSDFLITEKHWTPEVISGLQFQAETGKVPVSGGGYGGPFAGEGFDSLWFDMSEIVRPTRDGIHGREYISTQVDLGKKLRKLAFENKKLISELPKTIPIPFPVMFNSLPGQISPKIKLAVAKAAHELGTFCVLTKKDVLENKEFLDYSQNIILKIGSKPDKKDIDFFKRFRIIEITGNIQTNLSFFRDFTDQILVSVRIPASDKLAKKIIKYISADIIHIEFDIYAKDSTKRFLGEVVEEVHEDLIKRSLRNKFSLVVSGGIASAEHVPKSIIYGADAVMIDYSLLAALGCSLWADISYPCPVDEASIDIKKASMRIKNLMSSWRDQLLEILGAMGIREVKRMRGEKGRSISYKKEQKKFMSMFQKSKNLRYDPPENQNTAGDCRWTSDLIRSTIDQAIFRKIPENLNYRTGKSAGGFDRLAFRFEENDFRLKDDVNIDLSIDMNKRDNRKISMDYPIYSGGMSFGSVSLQVMLARAGAAKKLNSFVSTGEGGYPDELIPFKDNVITQVATGLFGVSEETIKRARIVEFKYAQGAKPGLGGHLLAGKVTEPVAKARESMIGKSLFSPFPFHSVYSVEDHKKHIDWIKQINPDALVMVKVSTPHDIDMVAIGSYHAGANIINIDGSYGGTGAAPDISKKNI
ncbi:hypothetical protein GF327_04830, partial [Candidatus Woesearchaeota archaeon]|nr:hypothetical protein [Candidatus Woesearchaeota archaeon]